MEKGISVLLYREDDVELNSYSRLNCGIKKVYDSHSLLPFLFRSLCSTADHYEAER